MGLFDGFKKKSDPELERIEQEAFEDERKKSGTSKRAAEIEKAKERGRLKAQGLTPTLTSIKHGAEKVGKALVKANEIRERHADSYIDNMGRANQNFGKAVQIRTARRTPAPKQRASPTDSLQERMNRKLI